MRKTGLLILTLILCLAVPISADAELSTGRGHAGRLPGYVPGEVLVKFRAENREAALQGYRKRRNFRALRRFRSIGVDHLQLPEEMTVEQAVAILRADPDVVYAEPNHYRSVDLIPDDPHFDLLWGLRNTGQVVNETPGTPDADIDAPEAWDVTTGSSEVVVAVIDTGLDFTHPDLAANVWHNPGEIPDNGIDDDENGYVDDVRGWDFVNADNAPVPNDANGHGTHVAGTIAAAGNDGWGVAGVSWNARIMSLRYLDAYGYGPTSDAILAIEYASAMGARVINNSWGGGGFNQALQDAIDASPALVACSAGNSAADTDAVPHYPGSYPSPNILTVAATDQDDALASFSNYGPVSVDVGAPGTNTYSCAPGRRTLWADDFDDGDLDGWTTGGKNRDWGTTDQYASSGAYAMADSPDGDYATRTNSWCRAPAMNLTEQRDTQFLFKVRGVSEPGYDKLYVEASPNNVDWVALPIHVSGVGLVYFISGSLAEWHDARVDLSALDENADAYVRFAFLSDWSNNYDGWYIDDVAITSASDVYDGTEYQFLSGTSMAAPHVSGLAALIAGLNSDWSAVEIKAAIEGTADPVPALTDKTATGARINAFRAVDQPNLPAACSLPPPLTAQRKPPAP